MIETCRPADAPAKTVRATTDTSPRSLRRRRRTGWAAAGLIACVVAAPCTAQTLRDPAWEQLLEGERLGELEAVARTRLVDQPADPQATLALTYAALGRGQPASVDNAVPTAEACVQRHPGAAECHFALGLLQGAQALRNLLKGMRLAGSIRTSFEKAVALAPKRFDHRAALMQFYLAAPAVAGGGSGKAQALAQSTQTIDAEQGKALHAMLAASEKRLDEAERLLWSVQPAEDDLLRSAVYNQLGAIAVQRLNDHQLPQALDLFERLAKRDPARAFAVYGLGRIRAESGAPADALKLYAQARGLRGQGSLPIDYREALAWLALGDNARGKALLKKFVDAGRGHPKNLEDARARLERLG